MTDEKQNQIYPDVINKLYASRFSFFIAKLFGVKRVIDDIDIPTGIKMRCTLYYFRDKYYMTEWRYL